MPFPDGFVWGAATSAYQIEGAAREDGRGLSVWDVAVRQQPGGAYQGQSADIACDHYHRYGEDVGLMAQMGLDAYRFSISWPRVLPEGVGRVNEAGLGFYDRLVDALLEAGIRPFPTLYHWDLPYALQLRGGWLNRDIANWFAEYTRVLVDRLSDRVAHWMTFNEPQIFLGGGPEGVWTGAGGRVALAERLLAIHHCLLAHGHSAQVIRAHARSTPQVGWAIVGVNWYPRPEDPASTELARARTVGVPNRDLWNNAWYIDPIVFGRYPQEGLERFGPDAPTPTPGDMETIQQPMDFMGLNVYHGLPGRAGENGVWIDEPEPAGRPRTALDWTVTPESLYWAPRFITERYGVPVYITEHGLSNIDWVDLEGRVRDYPRIDFTRRYLMQLERAVDEGVDVRGYFHWSLLDNFEWMQGFKERFGLIHVNYETLERTPKDSARWYARVIESHGAAIHETPESLLAATSDQNFGGVAP